MNILAYKIFHIDILHKDVLMVKSQSIAMYSVPHFGHNIPDIKD